MDKIWSLKGNKISWKTPGSDVVHEIPKGAVVTLVSGLEELIVFFDDDGKILRSHSGCTEEG